MRKARHSGFTLLEMLLVIAVAAIAVALAAPGTGQWLANQRLNTSARSLAGAFSYARGESIRTGSVWLVFFQTDANGNALQDSQGATVPILLVDDGRPGTANQNCDIDTGETVVGLTLETGVGFGLTTANAQVSTDNGSGSFAGGSSFTNASSADATWVLFLPQGLPTAFDADCSMGGMGSGGGAVYLTNGVRDAAAVVTPLGANRVYTWNLDNGSWGE